MIHTVMDAIFAIILCREVRTSTRFEPCDLAISVGCSNQLSYEATDVGSWSCVGPNVPVRNESMLKLYMK